MPLRLLITSGVIWLNVTGFEKSQPPLTHNYKYLEIPIVII